MIRRFLVISNRVSFSSVKLEEEKAVYCVDLNMPIETYWQMRELLREADFLLTNPETSPEVGEFYKKVFVEAAPYAIAEVDRQWLYKHSQASKPRP